MAPVGFDLLLKSILLRLATLYPNSFHENSVRRWFLFFRGGRPFTGSNRRWLAVVAEALFAAALLLSGVVLLVVLLTLATLAPSPNPKPVSPWIFWLQLFLSGSLIGIGMYWIARLLWQVRVSAERRGAITTRANELELLTELRQRREDLPTVPRDQLVPQVGRVLSYRLVPSPRNVWGLVTSALFSVVLVALVTILILIVVSAFQSETTSWMDLLEQRFGPNQLGDIPDRPWLAAALVVPIGLATCWSIFLFFRQLLKLTGIGPTSIEISGYPLMPGQTYDVFLSQSGRVRLKLLDVRLVCQEEATFNQGTDIRTERSIVFEKRLFRRRGISVRPREPFETEFVLQIPDRAMHSFKSQNNRVQWKIVVTGQAKNWPRLRRNFAVTVHPGALLALRPKTQP